VYPGATELCNGIDDDCDGDIDELPDTCEVPAVFGICAAGAPSCDGVTLTCEQTEFASDEICGNGEDDDCDGEVDEVSGCVGSLAGEVCFNAEDLSAFGAVTGDLTGYAQDEDTLCGSGGDGGGGDGAPDAADRFYTFTAAEDGALSATVVSGTVTLSFYEGTCGALIDCGRPEGEAGGFPTSEGSTYFVGVDGAGAYSLLFGFDGL
jgi:hypothetical protein